VNDSPRPRHHRRLRRCAACQQPGLLVGKFCSACLASYPSLKQLLEQQWQMRQLDLFNDTPFVEVPHDDQ
jgi:hypothetical protein